MLPWPPVISCPIGFFSTILERLFSFAVAGTIFDAICMGTQNFHPIKSDKTSFSVLFHIKVLAFVLAD
jgi:hypothetical protein